MVEDLGVAWLKSGARPLGPGGIVEGRDRRRDVPRGGNIGGVLAASHGTPYFRTIWACAAGNSPLAAGRAAR